MGNILSKVKSSRKVEKVEDRLGGFQIHPTAIYDAIVNKMYTFKSGGGALAVVLEAGLFLTLMQTMKHASPKHSTLLTAKVKTSIQIAKAKNA